MKQKQTNAFDVLERLRQGNSIYLEAEQGVVDVSLGRRLDTYQNGQRPYAVVVTCADSRVIPEAIFSAGIGELFVIRVAGNVVGDYELGSVEYAVEHLGARLVLVLGHTGCGAVNAALKQNHGLVRHITDEIRHAIGDETDEEKASVLNVLHSVRKIEKHVYADGLVVVGALYHTESGMVDFGVE